MIKPEEVHSLDDEQLMKALKQAGLNKGPLTSTTRSLYEKKLIKFLKENKLPEDNITLTQTKTPSKSTKISEKPKQQQSEPLKESNKNENVKASIFEKASNMEKNKFEEEQIERIKQQQQQAIKEQTKTIQQPEPRVIIPRIPEKKVQDVFESRRNEPVQVRPVVEEFNMYESISTYSQKKTDPFPIKTVQEPKIMYPSSSQKQQSMFAPPLNMQRERTASRESLEPRNKPQLSTSIFDKIQPRETRDYKSSSSTTANSTLPLEFKLISKDEPKPRSTYEERPFLGYIKTDRQNLQQNYLLNRRSIMKLDQSSPLRDQNKSPEFNSKPVIDLSPRMPERKLDDKPSAKSSITITKINQNNQSDWLKNNLKYLLAVFIVTVIVYYSLQSTEENPLFE